jgi:hypothetical protein
MFRQASLQHVNALAVIAAVPRSKRVAPPTGPAYGVVVPPVGITRSTRYPSVPACPPIIKYPHAGIIFPEGILIVQPLDYFEPSVLLKTNV